jgi:hypothetical protein
VLLTFAEMEDEVADLPVVSNALQANVRVPFWRPVVS